MSGKRRPMDVNLSVVEGGCGKHWTKSEIEERKNQEPKFPKPKSLTPPDWMSQDAKKLFRKYAKLLLDFPAGVVSKLDIGTLARYCDCELSYAAASNHKNVWLETAARRLQELSEASSAQGMVEASRLKDVQRKVEKASLAYEEAKKQVDFWSGQMVKFEKIARSCATEMGMTVSSRCKLVVPQPEKQEDDNPLTALLSRYAE